MSLHTQKILKTSLRLFKQLKNGVNRKQIHNVQETVPRDDQPELVALNFIPKYMRKIKNVSLPDTTPIFPNVNQRTNVLKNIKGKFHTRQQSSTKFRNASKI